MAELLAQLEQSPGSLVPPAGTAELNLENSRQILEIVLTGVLGQFGENFEPEVLLSGQPTHFPLPDMAEGQPLHIVAKSAGFEAGKDAEWLRWVCWIPEACEHHSRFDI